MASASYSTEFETTPPRSGTMHPALVAVSALLALAAGGLALWRYGSYGLLGFDTYPLIASSRSVPAALTQPLMWGFYPDPFYRPALALSFALDHALWGLDGFGYHLTDALAFSMAALVLALLARRIAGPGAFAPLVTLVAFVLHPTHVEVLPVPSRRGELLCCLFLAAALLLQLAPGARGLVRRRLLPAAATLLSIASKETGFVAVPLVFIASFALSEARGWRARSKEAIGTSWPHALVALAMLGIRLAVLGGVGGHTEPNIVTFSKGAFTTLFTLAGWLVAPQPVMLRSTVGLGLIAALVIAIAGASLVWAAREEGPRTRPVSRIARGLIVALAWIVMLDLIYAASGWLDTWYALLPVAGWSLALGLLAALGAHLFVTGDRLLRGWVAAAMALLAAFVIWQGTYSPLFRPYREWWKGNQLAAEFLAETGTRLDAAAPGDIVEAPPMPIWVRPRGSHATVFGAAVFADYSIQAWADLTRAEQQIVVAPTADPAYRPAPGKILLRIPERIEVQ